MCCSRTTRRRPPEAGFVLATTLLVTTLLTVMLAASYLLVSAEQRTTDNSYGSAHALALAQAGLQNYLAQHRSIGVGQTYDSTRITLDGGYADLVGRQLRPGVMGSSSPLALWLVRSTGVATSPVMAGQVQGTHTFAQFALLNPGVLPARAAMVALNGVSIPASPTGTYPLSGEDLASSTCAANPGGAAADTFAVSVPQGGLYSATGTTPTTSRYGILTVDSLPFVTVGNLYDSTHVDWASLLAGNFDPDYTVPPGPWPSNGNTDYPVGFVNGDVTLPIGQKRGLLVVTGDVTAVSGSHWDGIILAGGNFTTSPSSLTNYFIHGMIVTGLDRALGQSVARNQFQRGALTIQWSWCYVQGALSTFSSFIRLSNGWVDTWSNY